MDKVITATASNGDVRIIAIDSKEIVNNAVKIHETSPVASAAIGRLLTAVALLGASLKGDEDQISMKIDGGGPAKGVFAVSDSKGNIKGYIGENKVNLPLNSNGKLDVRGAVGTKGNLTIIKNQGYGNPYTGVTDIISGEIAEDLAYYFTMSEQTPSAVALGVLVDVDFSIKAAGGFIIQMLPGHEEGLASLLEYRLEEMVPLSKSLEEGKTIKEIIDDIFYGMEVKYLDEKEVKYSCNCSRDRAERALMSLGKDILEEMLEEEKNEEIHCEFCKNVYSFSNEYIEEILKDKYHNK